MIYKNPACNRAYRLCFLLVPALTSTH